jgi:hypothetical protein
MSRYSGPAHSRRSFAAGSADLATALPYQGAALAPAAKEFRSRAAMTIALVVPPAGLAGAFRRDHRTRSRCRDGVTGCPGITNSEVIAP